MAANEENQQRTTAFIATEVRRTLDTIKIMSLEGILSEVRNERLFGCLEVDIRHC